MRQLLWRFAKKSSFYFKRLPATHTKQTNEQRRQFLFKIWSLENWTLILLPIDQERSPSAKIIVLIKRHNCATFKWHDKWLPRSKFIAWKLVLSLKKLEHTGVISETCRSKTTSRDSQAYFQIFRLRAKKGPAPPLGNFADISYLDENFKPHL